MLSHTLSDQLATSVVLLNVDFGIVLCNSSAQELLALAPSRLLGKSIWKFLSPESDNKPDKNDGQPHSIVDKIQSDTLFLNLRFDAYCQTALDKKRRVHASLKRLLPESLPEYPSAEYVLELAVMDKHIASDQEARQRAASDLHKVWVRNLAHELKNPLGGMLGSIQLLKPELSEELSEYASIIEQEAKRMTKLLDELLLPQRVKGTPQTCNIHEVCEYTRQLILAEFPTIRIERDYDISLPEPKLVREQWIQILLNLLRNGAQELTEHPPQEQGTILVQTRISPIKTFAGRRHKQAMQLEISDNGRGIAPAVLPNLFHPLVTGRANGTGIGLSLVQSLIHAHGGSIRARNSETGGAVFTVLLPL